MHIERHVLSASEIMTLEVITVRPDMEIHEAIDILVRRRISGAPVCDDDAKLVGILSGKDCLRVLAGESFHDLLAGNVSDFMTTDVHTIEPDTDIFSIAGKFLANHYRRLPVCDDGRVVGIVARDDVLRGIQQMDKQLKNQSYPDYRRPSQPEKVS